MVTAALAKLIEKVMGDIFARSGTKPPAFLSRKRPDRGFYFRENVSGHLNNHQSLEEQGGQAGAAVDRGLPRRRGGAAVLSGAAGSNALRPPRPRPICFAIVERRSLYAGAVIA
jgi:hypothetical protein